jgi:glycosyltransferase involved in cell wall biosynthesis
MLEQGIESNMWVARKGSEDPTVKGHDGLKFKLASELDRKLWKLQQSPTVTWRSPAKFTTITAKEINASDADVVNLHWVTDGFLSIEEIGKITKPIVWSMYDLWPISGTEHYQANGTSLRRNDGYTKSNRPENESRIDIDRNAYNRKQQHWNSMHMVPASTWLEAQTRNSALMRTWPITRISHVIDTQAFQPQNKDEARRQLNLPTDVPLVLFLASAGIHDHRKGWDLLEAALEQVKMTIPNVEVVIVGPKDEAYAQNRDQNNFKIHWYGFAESTQELAMLYNAADVTAVPSREDNMPLTAMEAQSCGRAVVAFNIGGLPDIVEHHHTGYLAQENDVHDLSTGLIEALEDAQHENHWGNAARTRAEATWSPAVVVTRYQEIYANLMNQANS